jgi:hypothetical protein
MSIDNKALAAALRANGHKDVRPVWGAAKDLVNSGLSIEVAAKQLATATKVSQPTATYAPAPAKVAPVVLSAEITALATAVGIKPAQLQALAAKNAAKPAAKPRPTRPALGTPMGHVITTFTPKGAGVEEVLQGMIELYPARPSMTGTGDTHDTVVVVNSKPQPRSTMSPGSLDRFMNGNGTRVSIDGRIYAATRTK